MSNTALLATAEATHDHQLLELHRELAKADQRLSWRLADLRHLTRPANIRFDRDDRRTQDEIVQAVQELIDAGDDLVVRYSKRPSVFAALYNEALLELKDVLGRIDSHERNYTGWQRYFLVTSSAGLVHRTTECSTCHKGRERTRFALVYAFSGHEVEHLVEAVGPLLCSVCFPEAPVEWVEQERITPAVAEVLFELGYDAFQTALAKLREKRAAAALKPKVARRPRRY